VYAEIINPKLLRKREGKRERNLALVGFPLWLADFATTILLHVEDLYALARS